jgi:lipopolysaccharide transport system ATP-binding protein
VIARAAAAPARWLRRSGQPVLDQGSGNFWALDDISFEIHQGEAVGIIGRNGAGKSTLLKILSRITQPTKGEAQIYGRVGSLLEVGTGFHPELTGKENIFLNGAILGMKRKEIERKFDEIVDFAEIEKFLDTPVKRYSSGMYVRLAFAVAAHLEPEILLVDEVLAVGDAQFQKKCLGKMEDVAQAGRTVLFVSHNMQAISTLTKRTILLETGKVIVDGQTYDTISRYRNLWHDNPTGDFIDLNKPTGVLKARVITSETNQIHHFGKPLTFEFEIVFKTKPKAGSFSFQVADDQMRPILYLWLFNTDCPWARDGKVVLKCSVSKPRIFMGRYSLITWVGDRGSNEVLERLEGICPFEVIMDDIPREYEWIPGTCTYIEDGDWKVFYPGKT